MPRQTPLTHQRQILRVIQAFQLMIDGKTQEQACAEAGISVDTFREISRQEDSGLEAFRALVTEDAMTRLGAALTSQQQILKQLIIEGKDGMTKTADRINIYRLLNAEIDRLAKQVRLDESAGDAAQEVLGSGPVLHQARSRLSVTIEVESESRQTAPVIEARLREPDPDAKLLPQPAEGSGQKSERNPA